jgi:microcystin-dependent protein
MPTLTIPNSFSDGGTISAAEHNANFNAVATLVNSTKLDADNLQDSAVTAAKLASNAVTTAKITDSNVTKAKIETAQQFQPGMVIPYAGSSAPTGWLSCDGSAVSRTTYADLFTVIGETHGQGDNSTTFNVPDYRGLFLRGVTGGSSNDPDAASRTAMATGGNTGNNVGSVQADDYKAHTHTVTDSGVASSGGLTANTGAGAIEGPNSQLRTTSSMPATGGNETRPKNAYVLYIIKT